MLMKKSCLLYMLLIISMGSVAQLVKEVRGTVTDLAGNPIAGASVMAGDGKTGTATDLSGRFMLRLTEDVGWLVVSFVGMETRKVLLRPVLEIRLREQVNQLEELMVVAYGKVKKKAYTGSAVVVPGARLKERPLTVVTHGLDGLVPGVRVAEGNGQPGSDVHIRIRGFGSVNADNEPVYVVDGAVFSGTLCDLNPLDIESVTLLKDAVSTALYGSGAGNGVVLITTRTASGGKPSLSFSVTQGFHQRSIPEYERVGVWDYYPLQWEMLRNGLVSEGADAVEAAQQATAGVYEKVKYNPFPDVADNLIVLPDGSLNPYATELLWGDDLDWEKAVCRKGYRGEYYVSYGMRNVKGGLDVSMGYLKEKGYVIASGLERFTGKISGDMQPAGWLKTGLSLQVIRTNCQMANAQDNASDAANPFYFTRYIGPVYPIHRHDRQTGDYILDALGNKQYDYENAERGMNIASLDRRNIVAETLSNRNEFQRNGVNGRLFGEFSLLRGLQFTVNVMLDSYDYRRKKYENNITASSPGRIEASCIRTTGLTANQLLTYSLDFGFHQLNFLAGHESYAYKYEYLYGNKQDQFLEGIYDMYNFQTLGRLNSYTDIYRKEGYFLQAAYGYDRRYGLSVSYRRDASSRFRPDCRWGSFWSAGAVWQMNEEVFMKGCTSVNELRWRVSYGETGNDKVLQSTSRPNTFSDDYYPWQSFYSIGMDNGIEPGIALSSSGNSRLKWESCRTLDVALEFRLWNWFGGCLEYFRKDTRDLLFKMAQPLSSGSGPLWSNMGKVSNQGIEISLDCRLLHTRHWNWTLGAHATFLRNKIREMPAGLPEWVDGTRKLKAGKPLYNFWLKEYRGVDPETGDALFAFDSKAGKWNEKYCRVDAKGDSLTYNSAYARYHYAGNPLPKVYGGITTDLKYKNIGLSAVLAYSIGGKVYNTGYQVMMYSSKYGQAFHRDMLKRWQQPGDVTDVPRLDDTGTSVRTGLKTANQINATSDRWLFNAGYLSIRSVTVDYRLGGTVLKKYGIRDARIFVSGENLFLLTALKGMDPRQAYKGLVTVDYTPARTFTLGLSFTI